VCVCVRVCVYFVARLTGVRLSPRERERVCVCVCTLLPVQLASD
jgi:hypothetical protein